MNGPAKIAVLSPYFRDGLVEGVVEHASAFGCDVHLWALDESWPEVAPFTRGVGRLGKFQALNRLLPYARDAELVVFVDDDVALPLDFVPTFVTIISALGAGIAQPALTADSHHSYPMTIARPGGLARVTNFVESGPVVAMSRAFLDATTPFPESNPMGWGLEAAWTRIAHELGMTMAIVDACPVAHTARPIAARYSVDEAAERMGAFLVEHGLDWSPESHRALRCYVPIFEDRSEYLDTFPAPPEAIAHGAETDCEDDLSLLWAVARLVRPAVTLELGTRYGASTRTLAHAVRPWAGALLTVDPADVAHHLRGVECGFLHTDGESLYEASDIRPDLLYIDTDPHDYRQTRHWLDTWVANRLRDDGVAIFHDVVARRDSIQVAQAVRDWWREHPRGWRWQEFPGTSGLGLLWRTGDRPDFEGRLNAALARSRRERARVVA